MTGSQLTEKLDEHGGTSLQNPQHEKGHPLHDCEGSGTESDPFVISFAAGDPTAPMDFSETKKWMLTSIVTLSVFAVTLTSTAYSGSSDKIMAEFDVGSEVYALGVSLFVLGFVLGPPVWAPLSELYGRRIWFVVTLGCLVAFVAATAGATNMASLLVFRFLSGTFGASPLTNAGGVIADLFPREQRGLAMALFAAAPFLGPCLGPILGGFVTLTIGWRWVHGICSIFIGLVWILGVLFMPETYEPVLLAKRARQLSKETGKFCISILEKDKGGVELSEVFGKVLKRPWVLLFREPIVLIASTYMAILYGTIYMFMGAFPIVYGKERGWNAGITGLAFLGLAAGMLVAMVYLIIDNNGRYRRLGKTATPEDRLRPAAIGAVALPVGMFAFAWTNYPSIHWSVSIILSAPFGFGCNMVFLGCMNYLIDAYTVYAASVLAAGAMLRCVFGAVFPLFTRQMYEKLGIHWASSVPAFLVVACVPFPFVMQKYGAKLRMKCKYAQEAAMLLARLQTDVVESDS